MFSRKEKIWKTINAGLLVFEKRSYRDNYFVHRNASLTLRFLWDSYADIASAQNANTVKIPFVDNDSGFGEPKRLATRWRRTAL